MKALRPIASVWRSAGRGMLSAAVVVFGAVLFPSSLQAQNEARYKVECTKGQSVVFEAECSSYRVCAVLARLCVDKFGGGLMLVRLISTAHEKYSINTLTCLIGSSVRKT